MQTERMYTSNNENTSSQYSMSDHYLTEDVDAHYETLKQFVIQLTQSSSDAEVIILNYDNDATKLFSFMMTISGSQPTRNLHNVSMAATT